MGNRYRLLKASWAYQARQFFETSTLHGVRYIAEHGRPMHERLLWFCSTGVGLVAALVIIGSLWEKFQTSPTITGLDTDYHSWDVPFPAITLCLQNPANETLVEDYINRKWPDADELKRDYYAEFLYSLTNISYGTLQNIARFTSDRDLPQNNLRELSFELYNQCHILTRCAYKEDIEEDTLDCCSLFYPIFTENGLCYAFNLNYSLHDWPEAPKRPAFHERYIEETDSRWSLTFEVEDAANNSVAVYLSASEDMPGAFMPPQHIWNKRVSKLSFTPKATFTMDGARQLSVKQRGCVFRDEVKLRVASWYTYSSCMYQCRMEKLHKACGCLPFFYSLLPEHRYCSLSEMQCVINNLEMVSRRNLTCPCPLGCEHTPYDIEKPHEAGGEGAGDGSNLEVAFLSWPLIRFKREVLFGWIDLLVSFGTIAGLFMGFSLLSGLELVYYFTMRAWCMLHTERDELELLASEYSRHETASVDLTLTPAFMKESRTSPAPALPALPDPGRPGRPGPAVLWRRDKVLPKARMKSALVNPYFQ